MAGINNVSDRSEMHVFASADDRNIVLFCEGNLSTTQAILEQWHRDKVRIAQTNTGDRKDLFLTRQ